MTKVLLVEDNPDEAMLMSRTLRRLGVGLELRWVSDAEAAHAALQDSALPSVVFMDIKLPRSSGLELLSWMRSRREYDMVPVVMLSTSEQTDDLQQAYISGANAYLVKPSNLRDLEDLMQVTGRFWLEFNRIPSS